MRQRTGVRVTAVVFAALWPALGAAATGSDVPQPAEFTLAASRLGNLDRNPDFEGWRRPDQAGDPRPQLRLTVTGPACASGGRYSWTLNGQPLGAERLPGGCRFSATAPAEGDVTVDLAARVRGADYAGSQTLNVSDQLIVSIGDSVASGEGNPDDGGLFSAAEWIGRRCHRSMLSGPAQAALMAERADAGSSISFVPLGCSGATVPEGLLGEYRGIQPDGEVEPSQLDLVNQIQEGREIDALMVSIGANDVGFSDIVIFCAKVVDCPNRRFDPDQPWKEAPPPARPLGEVAADSIAEMERRYAAVDERLTDAIPVDRVFIVEYFDPTRGGLDADGDERFCRVAIPPLGEIAPGESQWARREVLVPLNEQVAAAAKAHGWTLAENVDETFQDHGICTEKGQRWIRRPDESVVRQAAPGLSTSALFARVSGTLHPNELGHLATAELIGEELQSALSEPTGAEEDDQGSSGVSPAVWISAAAIVMGAVTLLVLWRRRRLAG